MKRAHRIALKPTPEQEALFGQQAGYARFAYNWAVGELKAGLEVGEWLDERTLRPRWNRVKHVIAPWCTDLSQNTAKYAIIDFGQAAASWGAYRKRLKAGQRPGRRVGFPRFKRQRHEQGFRADNGPDTVRTDGMTVVLPKLGRVALGSGYSPVGSIEWVQQPDFRGNEVSYVASDHCQVVVQRSGSYLQVGIGVAQFRMQETPALGCRFIERQHPVVERGHHSFQPALQQLGKCRLCPSLPRSTVHDFSHCDDADVECLRG